MNKPVTYVCFLLLFGTLFHLCLRNRLLISFFRALAELKLKTGQSRIAMPKKMCFQMFFAVDFDYLNQNPKAHIKFEAFYQQRTTYVLLNYICFWLMILAVHLYTYLEGSLTQQFGKLFQRRKYVNSTSSVQRSWL